MIFQILYFIIFGILSALSFWLPGYGDVPLLLPWGMDSLLTTASSYYHGAISTLPYLDIVMKCFLLAVTFEIAMMFIKLFLGNRAPGQNAN